MPVDVLPVLKQQRHVDAVGVGSAEACNEPSVLLRSPICALGQYTKRDSRFHNQQRRKYRTLHRNSNSRVGERRSARERAAEDSVGRVSVGHGLDYESAPYSGI